MFRRAYGLVFVLTLAVMFTGAPARAQNWSLYGQATGATLRLPNTGHLYGGTFGLMRMKHNGPLSYGLDFRAVLLGRGNVAGSYTDERMDVGTIGFRGGFKPTGLPMTIYGEGALGVGYFRGGAGLTRQDKTGGTLEGRAGLDYHVLPTIDWRVIEMTYSRLSGNLQVVNPITASTGIVIHFP